MSVVWSLEPAPEPRYFPSLYKRSNSGSVLQWKISVLGTTISVVYGVAGGNLQAISEEIKAGKNLGKMNATTPEQQTILEAEARWRKKQEREGYVTEYERAAKGERNAAGGVPPMLAQPLKDAVKHLKFPCDAQRKYNGVRCIAVVQNGKCTLWSRKQTLILGVPHIVKAYEQAFCGDPGTHIFDGELYRHGWPLQKISGYVRKRSEAKSGFAQLSHFVYDLPGHDGTWSERREALRDQFLSGLNLMTPAVQLVHTVPVYDSLATAKKLHDEWVQEGYEGVILRDHHGFYEQGKRSYRLVKMKEFEEAEFQIIDVREGRGRMEGKAVFLCRTPDDKEFEAVAPGSMQEKARFFRRKDEIVGSMLTVRYFETTEGGKPSQAVGVCVRDFE
jgi:ATP-dependent DNA ligase